MICKLREIMDEQGLNQKQVADATGLSPTIIGSLYRHPDIGRIDAKTAKKLMRHFGLKTLNDLYEIRLDED